MKKFSKYLDNKTDIKEEEDLIKEGLQYTI